MKLNEYEDSLTNCTSRKDGLSLLQKIAEKLGKEEIVLRVDWRKILDGKDWYHTLHHARFLNNIVICYIKKDMVEDGQKLVEIISDLIDSLVILNEKQDTDFMYHFYSIFWNTSLKLSDPKSAIVLQKYALKWLSLSGQLSKCLDLTLKVCHLLESKLGDYCLLEDLVSTVLQSSTVYLNTVEKPAVHKLIPSFYNLLSTYGKYLLALNKCKAFSKNHEPVIQALDKHFSSDIILTLKLALKLTGYVMALATQKCTKERFLDALEMSSHAKNSEESNVVICDFYAFLLSKNFHEYSAVKDNFEAIFVCLVKLLIQRFPDGKLPNSAHLGESVSKHLSLLVKDAQLEATKQKKLSQYTLLVKPFHSLCKLLDEKSTLTQIFNIGVELCNCGVLSYMNEYYDYAVKYLEVGLFYLRVHSENEAEKAKQRTLDLISKKAGVLKDAHRYGGDMMGAMRVAFEYFDKKLFSINDVISTWTKCKRDATKLEKNELEGLCFQDVHEKLAKPNSLSSKLDVNELLIMEIKSTYISLEDQMITATKLTSSTNIVYQIKANLALCRCHWYRPDPEKKDYPISFLIKAQKLLLKYKKSLNYKQYLWMELQGHSSLWAYLCVYQVLQNHNKESESTSENADAEAITPRVSTEKSSFAVQQATIKTLFDSLAMWKELARVNEFDDIETACNVVLTIGRIFALLGLETHSLEAFLILIQMSAKKVDLLGYWMESLTQIVWTYPKYVPESKVQELKNAAEENLSSKQPSEARSLSALCTIAYYYYHTGEILKGASLIMECLQHPYLNKKTISSTEVCIRVLIVYSHFCVCPSETLKDIGWQREHANVPALNAARKASGVLMACAQSPVTESISETFRLTWLYLISVHWLSRLSYETAQPRVPRSFLAQTLSLTEEFVIPIRTAEFISTASSFEVLCDKFDDNITRVDSFSELLKSHNEPVEEALKTHCNTHFLRVLRTLDKIPSVTEDEYTLEPIPMDGLVIGHADRISYLATGGPSSPSILTKKSIIKECTCSDANCYVCHSRILGESIVNVCIMMSVMYAAQNDQISCNIYLKQAKEKLKRISAFENETQEQCISLLTKSSLCANTDVNTNIIHCVELKMMFHEAEILCILGNFSAAQKMNHEAIKLFIKAPSMTPSETLYVPKILVQSKLIENAISMPKSLQPASVVEEEESETSNAPVESFQTPPRSEMPAPTNRIRLPRKNKKIVRESDVVEKLQELNLEKSATKSVRTPRSKVKEAEKTPASVKSKENKVRTRRNRVDQSPTEPKSESGFGRSRRTLRRL